MIGDFLQPTHLIFILVVALLVLGPKRLPEVGRSLGKGIRDFRGAMSGIEEHVTGGEGAGWAHDPTPAAPVTPATTTEPSEAPAAFAIDEDAPAVGFAAQVPAAQEDTTEALASVAADRPAASATAKPAIPPVAHEPEPHEYAD